MKSSPKSKIKILIALGILFALSPIITVNLSFIVGNNNKSSEYSDDITLDNKNLKISAVSGRIHIDNNWSAAKIAGICTGNGTYSEPYIIEDLVIDANNTGSGILIENSDVYFKIENCSVYNSRFNQLCGIRLSNVNNSLIITNNCSWNYYGIYLSGCNNNTISGNNISYSEEFGIYLSGCNNNMILGNIVSDNEEGIFLTSSWCNTISGNNISYSDEFGMYFYNSNNNMISGNTANNNGWWGISLRYSENNTISRNTANNNNMDGIYLFDSNNNTISGNTANNNYSDGIHLFKNCDNNTVSGNIANYNTCGTHLSNSDYNTVSGNTANNNSWGIHLSNSDYNTVSGNTANYNSYGVYLYYSNYNTISGNLLIGNDKCIKENNCTGNKFSDNGACTYGQGDGVSFEMILLISIISGGAIVGVVTILLIRHKRKRI
jgi:parallel beta-helix repeat protein